MAASFQDSTHFSETGVREMRRRRLLESMGGCLFSKDGEWSQTFMLRANLRRAVAFDIMATAENAEPDAPNTAVEPKVHEMRISDHTQIKNAVRFALQWLQDYPGGQLTLHTLPAPPKPTKPGQAVPTAMAQEDEGIRTTKRRRLASPTDDLPRLISVVEIIKREFYKQKKAGSGNPPGTLLHQYNVLACLEDDQPPPRGGEEGLSGGELFLAFEGKNHLKRNLTPYMKITLCTEQVPHLEEAGATYQGPEPPKPKSKSAKVRARKAILAKVAVGTADASVSE